MSEKPHKNNGQEKPDSKKEAQAGKELDELKMLNLAQMAAEAKRNGESDKLDQYEKAIKDHLQDLYDNKQLTEDGLRNRTEQIDRIIDNASGVNTEDEKESTASDENAEESKVKAEEGESEADEVPSAEDEEEFEAVKDELESDDGKEKSRGRKLAQKFRKLARNTLGLPGVGVMVAMGAWGNHKEKKDEKFKSRLTRRENETDKQYEKRKRRNELRANIGIYGAAIAGVAIYAVAKGMQAEHAIEGSMGGGTGLGDQVGSGSGGNHEDIDQDGHHSDGGHEDILDNMELSRQGEIDWLNGNGRIDNDFNDLSGSVNSPEHADLFAGYDGLMEQYHNSPHELAAQLSSMHDDIGVQFPPELSDLNPQPGESYSDYVDRVAGQMHDNPVFHQDASKFMAEYLQDHADVQDFSPDGITSSSYIIVGEDGKPQVGWDNYVSPENNRNDKFIVLGYDANGNRIGIGGHCGQPMIETKVAETVVTQPTQYTPVQSAPAQYVAPAAPQEVVPDSPNPVHNESIPPSVHHDTPNNPGNPTQPPETQPPVTQPPETQPPVTQPPETEPPVTQPPETLAPKDINSDDIGIWDAPKATTDTNPFDQLGDPVQNNTAPEVHQDVGGAIDNPDQTGGMASGAEQNTPEQSQTVEQQPPATGATSPEDPGTQVDLFGGDSTISAPDPTEVGGSDGGDIVDSPQASVDGGPSGPATS